MQSVFIRHRCSSTPAVLQELWNRRLIALHYGNSYSVDPESYPDAGRNSLNRLRRYCRDGAIVAADFRELYRDRLLIGEIKPGTEITAEAFGDEKFVYKVVPLINVREVKYADFPVLMAIQPRQGTLVGWPSAENVLKNALYDKPLGKNASSLSPDQLEVICYEFLRSRDLISRLLMPIGRGLVDVDILGIDHHKRTIFAQVTQSRNCNENNQKMENLLAHKTDGSELYYFGKSEFVKESDNVTLFDIDEVFEACLQDDDSREMIYRMLGHRGQDEK